MPIKAHTSLLAENDAEHAQLMLRNLPRSGLRNDVVHVTGGQQALDYIHRRGQYASRPTGKPLLLLLDIKMPRIDGIEVLRQIKSDPATEPFPVVMLPTTRAMSSGVTNWVVQFTSPSRWRTNRSSTPCSDSGCSYK